MPRQSINENKPGKSRRPRRWLRGVTLALVLAASPLQSVHAQAEPETANETDAAEDEDTSPIQTASRPMTMEIVIVFLMVGAALFVVCKSSRRN